MIVINPIKNSYQQNKLSIKPQSRQCSEMRHDAFVKVAITPSFRGLEKEINLHFTIKDAEKLFAKTYRKIIKEPDIDKKIELTVKCRNEYFSIIDKIPEGTYEELGSAKYKFIDDMHHELHSPLILLYGRIHELRKDNMNIFTKSYENYFKEFSNRTIATIKRYKFFLDNGLENNQMKPESILKLALDSVNEKAKQKNVKIKIKNEKNLIKSGEGIFNTNRRVHDYELYTVFSNLLQNATKYTKNNSTVMIDFKKQKINDKIYLKISVQDVGIGIPKDEQEKVLKGVRATNAIASGIEGTGYGLIRVDKILKNFSQSYLEIKSPLHPNDKDFPGTKINCYIELKNA